MWWWGREQTGSKRVKDNSNVHSHESLFRHGGGEGGRQAARGLKITAMYTAMNHCSDMVVGKGADRQQER